MNKTLQLNFTEKKNIYLYWWSLYCELNKLPLVFPKESSIISINNHLSLKKRVINSFLHFYSLYENTFDKIVQNTSTSKKFKTLILTKKAINLFAERLIKINPNIKFFISFYYELHSCWKPCHWKNEIIKDEANGITWSNHNRNFCQCFLNSKSKHWKCKRKWHSHNWHSSDLILPSIQDTKINLFLEEINDKDTRLCYNMKDWKNFKTYPKEYRQAGLNFKKKWYWVIDSERFLLERKKKSERNIKYRLENSSEIKKNLKEERIRKRRNLQNLKSKLNSKLKKISWSKGEERKKLSDKIKKISFELAISFTPKK